MKVVYRNGKKFVVTDALYEAAKSMLLLEDDNSMSDHPVSQKDQVPTPTTQTPKQGGKGVRKVRKTSKSSQTTQTPNSTTGTNPWEQLSDKEKESIFAKHLSNAPKRIVSIIDKESPYKGNLLQLCNFNKKTAAGIVKGLSIDLQYGILQNKQTIYNKMESIYKSPQNANKDISKSMEKCIGLFLFDNYISDESSIDTWISKTEQFGKDPTLSKEILKNFIMVVGQVYSEMETEPSNNQTSNQTNKQSHEYQFSFFNANQQPTSVVDKKALESTFTNWIDDANKSMRNQNPGVKIKEIQFNKLLVTKNDVRATLFIGNNTMEHQFIASLKSGIKDNQNLFTKPVKYIQISVDGTNKEPIDITSEIQQELSIDSLPSLLLDDKYEINDLVRDILTEFRNKNKEDKNRDQQYKILLKIINEEVNNFNETINKKAIETNNWEEWIAYLCSEEHEGDDGINPDKSNFDIINIIHKTMNEKITPAQYENIKTPITWRGV